MKASFFKNLYTAFMTGIVLLVISSAISFIAVKQSYKRAEWVTHTHKVIQQLELLISTMKDAETGVRGYLITGDTVMLDPYNGSAQRTLHAFNEVTQLTRDNRQQQQSLPLLKSKIVERYNAFDTLVRLKKSNVPIPASSVLKGKLIMDDIRLMVQTLQNREENLLKERTRGWKSLSAISPYLIVLITLISAMVSYYFCSKLKRTYFTTVKLRKKLQTENIKTNHRIAIIKDIADKIAGGNYKIRLEEKDSDVLGNLAISLNQMAISLEYSFSAIQELMVKKDDFIGIAAHELKTPLTSIKAYLQFIGRSKLNTEEGRSIYPFIAKANTQVNRLTEIIKDLLDVSRINEGQLGLKLETFSIRDAALEATDQLLSSIKTHELIIEGEPDIIVEADKLRIEQVLVNLISNGIKYSPNGNRIILHVKTENNVVKISITDNGIGIQKETLPYIFERYFRVESSSQNFSGMGLGLYISKGIVERHGGHMGVESKFGEGSTFWFTLPLKQS